VNSKKILTTSILALVIILMVTSLCAVMVSAKGCSTSCTKTHTPKDGTSGTYCPLCSHFHDTPEYAFTYNSALSAYSSVFNYSDGTNTSEGWDLTSAMRLDITQDGFAKKLFDDMQGLYESIAFIGIFIVIIYFFVELAEVNMNDGFTYETLLKHTVKTIIAIIIIDNGYEVVRWVLELSTAIIDEIGGIAASNGGGTFKVGDCPWNRCNDIFQAMGAYFDLIIPGVANLVISLICWVLIFMRVFDIMIRVIFAPIGLSEMVKEGYGSTGFPYLKKLLASGLQGAVMLVVSVQYSNIASAITTSSSAGALAQIIVGLCTMTVLFKSGQIAKEILGQA
jgi:hypothetical protein